MSAYQECLSIIYEALEAFLQPGQVLSEDSALVADLGLSSLQVMELVADIEDKLDITIPLNVLPDVRNVRELAQLLAGLRGAKS
jgi:acyl carrier protein